MTKKFAIYLTTNLVTGKKYIGLHSKNNNKYFGSGTLILKAIKKYGKQNFQKEILEESDDIIEANRLERCYIDMYNAVNDDNFYNLSYGGEGISGRKHSSNTCSKISNALKKAYETDLELRYKVGSANRGKPSTQEKILKISKVNTGKLRSNECKKLLSDIAIKRYDTNGLKYPALINIQTGEIIESGTNIRRLAKKLNVPFGNLHKVIIGKRKTCNKWQIL